MTAEPIDRAPHSRRNAVIVVIVLAVVGLLAWWWVHHQASDTQGPGQGRAGAGAGGPGGGRGGRPSATVGVARAASSDIPVTVSAIGTVQPVVTATVRTQLAGVLFAIHFTEGQTVRKGQSLAQIDPRPYRLALTQAEGTLNKDKAALDVARTDLKRYQTLLQQDSIARQQVDTQASLVKQAEGTVKTDQAAVASAELNIGYTEIKAPVSGRIGLRQADIGNYLTPGDANGIVVITQTDPIDVAFSIPQDKLRAVAQSAARGRSVPATATDQDGSTTLATGHFLTLDNQVDATTGTVKAKARFANPTGALFPAQFVNVTLLVDTLKGVTTVPVSAVRHGAQGDFVFVLQADHTVKLTVVKTGPTSNGLIAVQSGLAAGATVITEGADRLDDGSKVRLPGEKGGPGAGGGRTGGRGHRQAS